MDGIDFINLYKLQDKVLDLVFQTEKEFYLTGGTCLHRFYHEKRYSDDLDFFTNNSSRYHFAIKNIKSTLQENFSLTSEVESKNFVRFEINSELQLDFVNDISVRYKDAITLENGYIIDNIENILSNKITAIIGRDNPKDIFDIFLIWKKEPCSWVDILNSAQEKASFSQDELIIRLKSFPPALLSELKIIDSSFLDNFENEFNDLIEEINQCNANEN